MKKIKFYIPFLVLFLMILSCDNHPNISSNGKLVEVTGIVKRVLNTELKESGGLYYFAGTPFTGVSFDMWNEKQIKRSWTFKNVKVDGTYKLYFENGNMRYEANIKDDKLEGIVKEYYENGKIMNEGNYIHGKMNGTFKSYFGNGQLDETYLATNGLREGTTKSYYANGQIKEETNYVHGRRNGPYKSFNENGTIKNVGINNN